jgi:predicted outer membrane repeat protein
MSSRVSFFILVPALAVIIGGPMSALGRPSRSSDSLPGSAKLVPPASTQAASTLAPGDVVFGGTFWNADSARWEAIEDSVWTFDTGVGSSFQHADSCKDASFHASMEGWTGCSSVRGSSGDARFRRLEASSFAGAPDTCVGITAGLGGSSSLWAGLLPAEAGSLGYAGGMGYGNGWHIDILKRFAYDGSDSLLLEYDFACETESVYDVVSVYADTMCSENEAGWVLLRTYDGTQAGSDGLVLVRGVQLPVAAGGLSIRFRVESDGLYSDEDGGYDTECGAFALDNVRVRTTPYGGVLDDYSDFETGNDGWGTPLCPPPDLTRLVHMDDLPPYDGGGPCTVSDSVLVMFDPATGSGYDGQYNWAASPWIDLRSAGVDTFPTHFVDLDIRTKYDPNRHNYPILMLQTYPVSGTGGEWVPSDFQWVAIFGGDNTCGAWTADISDDVPPGTEQVRIGLGVYSDCGVYGECGMAYTTPWYDNVRYRVRPVPTLQAMIDAAAAGDTVWVPPGTYTGVGNQDLAFDGKEIVFKSMAGAAQTILEPEPRHQGFAFRYDVLDSTAVIEGFTFRGAEYWGFYGPAHGGGMEIGEGADPTIRDCVFESNRADRGGALCVRQNSGARFERCVFTDNTAILDGGAVYIETFTDSLARVTFTDCVFQGNQAALSGGAIVGGRVDLNGAVITGNLADYGGAVAGLPGSDIRLVGSTVTANRAGGGGALHLGPLGTTAARIDLVRSIVRGSCADSAGALAAFADTSGTVTLSCSALDSTEVGGPGHLIILDPPVYDDPRWCLPAACAQAPTTAGDYTLSATSPCLPAASPCGQRIGALGEGCAATAVPGSEPGLPGRILSGSPNPFRNRIEIAIAAPGTCPWTAEVYDPRGRLVRTLVSPPGGTRVAWDGRDERRALQPAGVYFVRIRGRDVRGSLRVVKLN